MYRRILIPTDGSEDARKATLHAFHMAGMSGADILGISVVDTSYRELWDEDISRRLEEIMRKQSENAISILKEEFSSQQELGHLKGTRLDTVILEGNPAEVILEVMEEEDVDLVVMGSSGKHGLDRIISGSITRKVLKSATKPVMVVG
ncbi:universal stress protein [Methanothermobacter thermautotrophicus]|uniref:Universal stress protein n=1 Tax=Methanothermobacter thermautotrophicus TaxID=145262 RepID=A0A842YMW9_METTF|nr:universal stress protein [Methanothermobacter thermautotrophicus]MBE2900317.1 universal stress protein [Methanothermobacter thermautotrophicus]